MINSQCLMVHKVVAYITRGRELLLFEHAGMPEAGLQVPAGTIEPDEPLDDALWREIAEESGITPKVLKFRAWLNAIHYPNLDLVRHFAWLEADHDLPNQWIHSVTGTGEDHGLAFAFRWEPNPPPELAGGLGECLTEIIFRDDA